MSVCVSVGPEGIVSKRLIDPGAVCSGVWSWSRGSDRQGEGAVLRVNVGRPIETNGDFVA